MKTNYLPFAGVVGNEKLKKALILTLINERLEGVLIIGEKGTAKSTLVRSLEDITDKKIINLPLSITEERLIGDIDLEKTIKSGAVEIQTGLLSEANQQILYIDEINLLQDNIVDLILNVQGMGQNIVERGGIFDISPCHFILIGTMNPEEGKLREHFVDRFGLSVIASKQYSIDERVKIVKSIMDFEKDPQDFRNRYEKEHKLIRDKIENAKELLKKIQVTEEQRHYIVEECIKVGVEGHRADIMLEEASKTIAAYDGRINILDEDILEAEEFVLNHRRKESSNNEEEQSDESENSNEEDKLNEQQQDENSSMNPQENNTSQSINENEKTLENKSNPSSMKKYNTGKSFLLKKFGHDKSRLVHNDFGKRTKGNSSSKMGRYIYPTEKRKNNDIALDATIRAAAPYQKTRIKENVAIVIDKKDIREKVRQRQYSNLIVIVVDASGSMGASQRMVETKGAILSLLKDAYVKRDKICLISFHGTEANVILPPTKSVERGVRLLEEMEIGGRTPLNHGLNMGLKVIQSELKRDEKILPYLILITDGKGNVSINSERKPKEELIDITSYIRDNLNINTMVLDIERQGMMSFGMAKKIAEYMQSDYEKIETLKGEDIINAVERIRN